MGFNKKKDRAIPPKQPLSHSKKNKKKKHKSKNPLKKGGKTIGKLGSQKNLKKAGSFGKKSIGGVAKFSTKTIGQFTAPLNNLTKSPTTLIIILGLGAFIVLKVMK